MANLFVNPSGLFNFQPTILDWIKAAKRQSLAQGFQPDRVRMSPSTYELFRRQTGYYQIVAADGLAVEVTDDLPPGLIMVDNRAHSTWLQRAADEYLADIEGIAEKRFTALFPKTNKDAPEPFDLTNAKVQVGGPRELMRLTPDGTLYINAQMMGLSDTPDAVISMSRKGVQRAVFQGHFELLESMPK